MVRNKLFYSIIFLFIATTVYAQKQFTISGVVSDNNGNPLELATVVLNAELYATTDAKGSYMLKKVPNGNYNYKVQYVGFKPATGQCKVNGKNVKLNIRMEELNLSLSEVNVTALQVQMGSKSKIDQEAIRHIQPKSLSDILQLVPGNLTQNPNMNNIAQAQIREIGNNNNNALGTSVIVDGTPLSNDANLQAVSPTRNGTASSTSADGLSNQTAAGKGIDLRTVSVGNVDYVEVVRGIPSVEYGNLTSGLVIVKTKAGKTPFEIKATADPNSKLVFVGKGVNIKNAGAVNVSLDWSQSWGDTRKHYQGFDRITAGLGYSNQFGPLSLNLRGSFYTNVNNLKDDPQMVETRTHFESRNTGVRLSVNGQYKSNNSFFTSVNYNLSGQFARTLDKHDTWVTNPDGVVTTSRENGISIGRFQTVGYQTYYQIEGKPYNFFGQLIAKKYMQLNENDYNTLKLGVDYTFDGNKGEGFTYDENRPPQAQSSHSLRPRSFKDIPSINALSFFLADKVNKRLGSMTAQVDAGVRYNTLFIDKELSGGHSHFHVLEPRVNASLQLLSKENCSWLDDLSLSGGYGLANKMPTLLYLYPDHSYFDNVSLAMYGKDPANRLALVTTDVVNQTANPNLKPTRSRKWEVGISFAKNKVNGFLTFFNEQNNNEYGFASQIIWQNYYKYSVPTTATQPTFDGVDKVTYYQNGVLETADKTLTTEIYSWGLPSNTSVSRKHGIEYGIDLGEWKPLATSLNISGAWLNIKRTTTETSLRSINSMYDYVSVMPAGQGSIRNRFNTTFRFMTHIPAVKMIFTTTLQVVWYESARSIWKDENGNDLFYRKQFSDKEYYVVDPLGIYDKLGNFHSWTPSDAEDSKKVLVMGKYHTYDFNNDIVKPWAMLCFRFTKELGKVGELSFIANNFTATKKWHVNKYTQTKSQLYPSLYFGAEMKVKL